MELILLLIVTKVFYHKIQQPPYILFLSLDYLDNKLIICILAINSILPFTLGKTLPLLGQNFALTRRSCFLMLTQIPFSIKHYTTSYLNSCNTIITRVQVSKRILHYINQLVYSMLHFIRCSV